MDESLLDHFPNGIELLAYVLKTEKKNKHKPKSTKYIFVIKTLYFRSRALET